MTTLLRLAAPTETRRALRRFATENDMSIEEAAVAVIRGYLIGHGYLEPEREPDEDTETEGNA